MFKDAMLSPVAIYNNTLWHNSVVFLGGWKAGGQHLVFNNIIAEPNEYWSSSTTTFSTSLDISKVLVNRMRSCLFAAQMQEPVGNNILITVDLRSGTSGGQCLQGSPITPFPTEADVRWLETKFPSTDPQSGNLTLRRRVVVER